MIKRSHGFYETFKRKDGSKTTTYCAGCGHGIIQKLIAEAIYDLGIGDRTVFVSPVGCAAFCFYYFDCGNVAGPHGRASAVATGVSGSCRTAWSYPIRGTATWERSASITLSRLPTAGNISLPSASTTASSP